MKSILSVGQIMVERQYLVDHVAHVDEVSFVRKVNSLVGSKELNAAQVLSRHNKVTYLGCIGADEDGKISIDYLRKCGIDYSKTSSTSKLPTGQVVVMTDGQGRSAITVYVGANSEMELGSVRASEYDFVYTSSANELNVVYELIEVANSSGIPILIDFPNKQKEFDKTKLEFIDYVAPNRQEAGMLMGEKILTVADGLKITAKLKQLTKGSVFITLDKDGCVAMERSWDTPKHFSTKSVKVKDSTASGDIFRGVFVSRFLKSGDFVASINEAVVIATKSCGVEGVVDSLAFVKKLI